jgi:hypothetical protein
MPKHHAAITDATEGAKADVGSVGNQTETGEEAEHEGPRHFRCGGECPQRERRDDSHDRSRPDDDSRRWIVRQVGAGNRQRMEYNARDFAAGAPGSDDMPELVDGLHPEPRTNEGRRDEDRASRLLVADGSRIHKCKLELVLGVPFQSAGKLCRRILQMQDSPWTVTGYSARCME